MSAAVLEGGIAGPAMAGVLVARAPANVSLRVRRAVPADVAGMVELLDGYAAQGLVLPRTADQVVRHFREFVIAEDAHGIVGCSGLRVYSPELGEVCALAVAERSQGTGVGRRMVEALLAEARMLRLRRVFAMTLQEGFFGRLGFVPVPLESIPEKVAADQAEGIDRLLCPKLAMVCELGN